MCEYFFVRVKHFFMIFFIFLEIHALGMFHLRYELPTLKTRKVRVDNVKIEMRAFPHGSIGRLSCLLLIRYCIDDLIALLAHRNSTALKGVAFLVVGGEKRIGCQQADRTSGAYSG